MKSNNQKLKPEYRDLTFKSEQEFKDWLKEKTEMIIHFKDNGQDCLMWYIDKGGEVLHSELQSFVWNGGIVDLNTVKVGKQIGLINTEKMQTDIYDFVIEELKRKKVRKNDKEKIKY